MVKALKKTQNRLESYASERTLAALTAVCFLIAVFGFGYISVESTNNGFLEVPVSASTKDPILLKFYRLVVALRTGNLEEPSTGTSVAAFGNALEEGVVAFTVIAGILGSYLFYKSKNVEGKLILWVPFIVALSLILVIVYENSIDKTLEDAYESANQQAAIESLKKANNTDNYAALAYITTVLFFNLSACYYLYKENGSNTLYLVFAVVNLLVYVLYLVSLYYGGFTYFDIFSDAFATNGQIDRPAEEALAASEILMTIFFATSIVLIGFYRR